MDDLKISQQIPEQEQPFNEWVDDHFEFLTEEEMKEYEEREKDTLQQQEGLLRGDG